MFLRPGCRNPVSFFALWLLLPLRAPAQEAPAGEESPRVERITFAGAEALDPGLLSGAILTQETRCRGLLLRPLCWVVDWNVVMQREYLERPELPRDELRLRLLYFRRGFRQASVTSAVRPAGRGVEVVFTIDEGPPTILNGLQVRQTEEVLSERVIRRVGLPEVGEPLNLVALDTAIAHLGSRLGARGYLDAVVRDTIAFSARERTAMVEVWIEPGRPTTLGELDIRGNEAVDDRTIVDALLLQEGGVLRNRDLVASQRSLYESNLFHEAHVVLPPQADSAKRLEVTVREAPPRAARIGGGFNTMEFGQVEARFTHYNWMGRGRRLDLRTTVGNLLAPQLSGLGPLQDVLPAGEIADGSPFLTPTWLVSLELMQPSFRAAANRIGLGVFAHRRIIPGIAVDQGIGASLSFTRQFDYDAPASLTYRFESAKVDAGDLYFCVHFVVCSLPSIEALREPHRLSPLALTFFTDRSDDPLAPTEGYRTRLEVEHASAITLSDFQYNRVAAEASYYRPLGIPTKQVLAGRVRVGWVLPMEGDGDPLGLEGVGRSLLHPRKRFYAGGSRSVRGYWENQLGPRVLTIPSEVLLGDEVGCAPGELTGGTCDPSAAPAEAFRPRPLGGTTVLEGNVEFRFPFWGDIRGAVFVDAAIVGERAGVLFTQGSGDITPGFGARMNTPVGPMRIDFGIRPSITEHLPVVTDYVDDEGVRRLVHLKETKRWNPAEARGSGFFGRALSHLRLHLSIGEAF